MNKGLAIATGEVLAWLNSDDTYASNQTLAQCVNYFREHADARFLYGKGYEINGIGRVVGEEHTSRTFRLRTYRKST